MEGMLGRCERPGGREILLFRGGGEGRGVVGGTVGGGPAFERIEVIDILEGVLAIGAGLAGGVPNSESCCGCGCGGDSCKGRGGCKELPCSDSCSRSLRKSFARRDDNRRGGTTIKFSELIEAFWDTATTSELCILVSDPLSESRSSIATLVPRASSSAFTTDTECIRVCLLVRGVWFACFKDVRDSSELLDLDSVSSPCFSICGLDGGLGFIGGTPECSVSAWTLELGVPGDAPAVASIELGGIGVELCEPGVGGERGDVNRVEST